MSHGVRTERVLDNISIHLLFSLKKLRKNVVYSFSTIYKSIEERNPFKRASDSIHSTLFL